MIKLHKHLFPRCGLKICVNQHGMNQCDLLLFGLCIYGKWPWKAEQIHVTAGIWKSDVFSGGKIYRTVLLIK